MKKVGHARTLANRIAWSHDPLLEDDINGITVAELLAFVLEQIVEARVGPALPCGPACGGPPVFGPKGEQMWWLQWDDSRAVFGQFMTLLCDSIGRRQHAGHGADLDVGQSLRPHLEG